MTALRIVPYRDDLAADFSALNRQWIEQFFTLEPNDIAALDDPVVSIIEPGGAIYFAVLDGVVVGTAAAIHHSSSEIELAKMAVTPASRRHLPPKVAVPDCDPPYAIDPQGVRIPRQECLGR